MYTSCRKGNKKPLVARAVRLYNIYIWYVLVIQDDSIVEYNAIAGKHNDHGLMPIVLLPLEMGLVEICIFIREQILWRRLCLEGDGIIHNAEHGFYKLLGFLIDELENGAFKYVFQLGIVPFPPIEEIGNHGTVEGGCIFQNQWSSHDTFDGRLWKDLAQT